MPRKTTKKRKAVARGTRPKQSAATKKPETIPEDGPRKPERWPMSEAARMVTEASMEALDYARAEWERAQQRHTGRIVGATKLDGLPKIGPDPGQIMGAQRDGDEWVEIISGERVEQVT